MELRFWDCRELGRRFGDTFGGKIAVRQKALRGQHAGPTAFDFVDENLAPRRIRFVDSRAAVYAHDVIGAFPFFLIGDFAGFQGPKTKRADHTRELMRGELAQNREFLRPPSEVAIHVILRRFRFYFPRMNISFARWISAFFESRILPALEAKALA